MARTAPVLQPEIDPADVVTDVAGDLASDRPRGRDGQGDDPAGAKLDPPMRADRDGIVRKHVNTIALMPTERRIGLLTRKLFNVMLRLAQQQGDTETYSAPLRELITLSRFDSKDYQLLRRTLRQMISTVVEWQSPTDREFVRWEACGLVSGVSLSKPPEAGGAVILQWSYAPQIRTQLLSPERYARLSLELMTRLRSHTALALYEICARYIDNPSHLTARQPWRWWKPVLTGQPDRADAHQAQYRYFKRDVLLPAIAEVNALTDIVVTGPIEARGPDNKTITTIQFDVRRREEGGRPRGTPAADLVDLPVIGYAIRNGLTQAEAERLLEQYDAERLRAAVDQLVQRQAAPGTTGLAPIGQPARWVAAVLEAGQKRQAAAGNWNARRIGQGVAPSREARWREEWIKRRYRDMRAMFLEHDEATREGWLARYREGLLAQRSVLVKRLDRDGWEHPMVRADFLRYFGTTMIGEHWDQPTAEDILALAAEIGDEPTAGGG
ncbi:MAG: RepB family plasmid replication initiator protein [bacterium]|jgi:hypothetical protein|nr:replication initiation protein [Betaproteobacteria bacterium]